MALGTYDQLVTSVTTWAMRTGDAEFEAAVPDFIALAEDLFNNGDENISALRLRDMEFSASVALTNGVGDLPADYLEYRNVSDAQGCDLTPIVPGFASDITGGSTRYFAIKDGTITTYPTDAGPLDLDYYQKIPALTASNPTNWLLTKAPRVYLFGSLLFAAPFMMDDARMSAWGRMLSGALTGLTNADSMSKFARAPISVNTPKI